MFSAGWWWIPSAADRGPPKSEPRRGTSRRHARNAKLTEAMIDEIRNSSQTHAAAAARYGVSKSLVRRVRGCR